MSPVSSMGVDKSLDLILLFLLKFQRVKIVQIELSECTVISVSAPVTKSAGITFGFLLFRNCSENRRSAYCGVFHCAFHYFGVYTPPFG